MTFAVDKLEQKLNAEASYQDWFNKTLRSIPTFSSDMERACIGILSALTVGLMDTASPLNFWFHQAKDILITYVFQIHSSYQDDLRSTLLQIANLTDEETYSGNPDNRYSLILEERFRQLQEMIISEIGEA